MVSFLEPEKIVEELPLKEDLIAADFGCGSGGFTIPLSKKLNKGFVYAVDIQSEPLSALEGNARLFGFHNIKTIRANLEEPHGSTLPDNSLDLVVIINFLFQVDEKERIFEEAFRVLKPKGKVIVVDWKKDSPFGPTEERVDVEDVKKYIRKTEFKFIKEIEAGTYHWGAMLEK